MCSTSGKFIGDKTADADEGRGAGGTREKSRHACRVGGGEVRGCKLTSSVSLSVFRA